jgi:hypothetical protein
MGSSFSPRQLEAAHDGEERSDAVWFPQERREKARCGRMQAWHRTGHLFGSQRSRLLDGAVTGADGSALIGDSQTPTEAPREMRELLLTSINVKRIPNLVAKIPVSHRR